MGSEIELRFRSRSPDATAALARTLGRRIPAGTVVTLDGDLGVGKTVFVKGLARGLGVEDTVDSPTFTLMKEYEGRLRLYHCDAWMQGRERAFLEGEGDELLHGDGVTVLEWGSRVADLLPPERVAIELEHRSPRERRIRLRARGRGPVELLRRLAEDHAREPLHPDLEAAEPGEGR